MLKDGTTEDIASDWEQHPYYERAEASTGLFWEDGSSFRRLFDRLDLSAVVELACGHGRHTPNYAHLAGKIHMVDVQSKNIEICRERLKDLPQVEYHVNDGRTMATIDDASVTSLFCYDAMVHFDLGDIASYLAECTRILRPGGLALFHHSNYDGGPGNRYSENPHARNFMNSRLFRHLAIRAGLNCADQIVIDWGGGPSKAFGIDCLTLCEAPSD